MKSILALSLIIVTMSCNPSLAEEQTCLSCRPVTVELRTSDEMLTFVTYAETDVQRQKVLGQLISRVIETGDHDLGIRIARRFGERTGSQQSSLEELLPEKTNQLRAFLATADSRKLVKVIRAFSNAEHAYSDDELTGICLKILAGEVENAIEGFDAGCRSGGYIDALRRRILSAGDPRISKKISGSDFGKIFITPKDWEAINASARR